MSVRGSPGGFVYAVHEGSREHVYALRRARWAEAFGDWLTDGRPDFLALETTPAPWGETHGWPDIEKLEAA
jgi:hypothetical protein